MSDNSLEIVLVVVEKVTKDFPLLIVPSALFIFPIIAIFIGIPGRNLCGGERPPTTTWTIIAPKDKTCIIRS